MSSDHEHIELVTLKIGLAETDKQLESILLKYLGPVLKKLQTTDDSLRVKVMSLLTHINKRLKSRENIQLPVADLIHQFNDCTMNSFVMNFSLIYLKTGYKRLSNEKKLELLPLLFHSIKGKMKSQQDCLLRIIATVFALVEWEKNTETRKWFTTEFKFDENAEQEKLLLDYFLQILIMPYSASLKDVLDTSQPTVASVPGLSRNHVRRLLGDVADDYWSVDTVELIKLAIVKFFKMDLVGANKSVAHLTVAASDTKSTVCTIADLHLRNSLAVIEWKDKTIARSLYQVYLGFAADPRSKSQSADDKVQPANIRMKLKLMQSLLRSPAAADMLPHNIQVVYDGLFAYETNAKLKTLALQFMHYIFDSCSVERLEKQAPTLLKAAVKLVREGSDEDVMKNDRLHSLVYISFTKLATRLPALFASKSDLVHHFIGALAKEESLDVKHSIVQAATAMIPAFVDLPEDDSKLFRKVVRKAILDKDHHIRMVGVRYAASIFKSDDEDARYMLLLATADVKDDVAGEAEAFVRAGIKSGTVPTFHSMLAFVSAKADERVKGTASYSIGINSLAFHPKAFKSIITFVFRCLLKEVATSNDQYDDDDDHLEHFDFDFTAVSAYVKQMKSKDVNEACVVMNKLIMLVLDYLSLVTDAHVLSLLLKISGACLHFLPVERLLSSKSTNKRSKACMSSKEGCIEWAQGLAYHNREEISYLGAELFSLLFSYDQPTPEKYIEQLKVQQSKLKSQTYEQQHGAILILAYLVGDYLSWSRTTGAKQQPELIKELVVDIGEVARANSDQNLVAAACFAIGETSRKSPLPLPDGVATPADKEADQKQQQQVEGRPLDKFAFVSLLRDRLRTKNSHRVRQRAAVALGRLCVGEGGRFEHRQHVVQALLDTSQSKDTDRHFVIGDALISCALTRRSADHLNKWTARPAHLVPLLDNSPPLQDEDSMEDDYDGATEGLESLLSKILSEYVDHRLPTARQASCIWLSRIMCSDECSQLPTMSKYLMKIQNAFTSLIIESDELTQDLASRGLCQVYEMGDQSQKETLVSGLVSSLTGGESASDSTAADSSAANASTVRIMGDESRKFFQDVKTKKSDKKVEGPALVVYKEMCSLASELNKPELVYKFLYLQNHKAATVAGKKSTMAGELVSTRKRGSNSGAADYKSVVASTREQLAPLHHKIIPRLYRSTFDPQPSVRDAMTAIWMVIAPEPSKAILLHLTAISDDLSAGLTHMLWRTRQASCLALIDLMRVTVGVVVGANPLVGRMGELWRDAMRVQDDMKESVRDAATKLCRALHKTTLKLIDASAGSTPAMSEEVLTDVLNALLSQGMLSRVPESRAVSVKTLVEVSKVSGDMIKPCISVLVISLLEALSDVEPPEINYMRNRSEQVTQDKLDWLRAEFVRSTPLMETAVRCVKHYDAQVLEQLVPSLVELTKRGVGVPTKAGCAYFATQMVSTCGNDLTPHAGKLLKVFVSGLKDSSLAIRKVNSSTVGHLSRVAKDAAVARAIVKFNEWYLSADDATGRHASASALYAIARHSPDVMQRHLAQTMPLAFYAMHATAEEEEEQQHNTGGTQHKSKKRSEKGDVTKSDDVSFDMSPREMFQCVWNEFTPGSETAVRIYLDEIVTLAATALQSQNWQLKAQAASTMSAVATHHSSHPMQPAHLNKLLEALLDGLRGRYWVGKKFLLSALKDLLCHHASQLEGGDDARQKVLAKVVAECRRAKNSSYRCEALVAFGRISIALKVDNLGELLAILAPQLRVRDKKEQDGESASSSDDDDVGQKEEARNELIKRVLPVVDDMWTIASAKIEHAQHFLALALDAHDRSGVYQIRVVCLTSIARLLESLLQDESSSSALEQLDFNRLHPTLINALGDSKRALIRHKAALIATLLCRLSKAGAPYSTECDGGFVKMLRVIKEGVSSSSIAHQPQTSTTAENMEALDAMKTAMEGIEKLLRC